MHPSVFTELLINLLKFLPFHWKLKLTSIRAIKNGVQRRHYVIFVGFGYKKSLGSSFFGAWADFHWNCERSFELECLLLIFIYFNSKYQSHLQKREIWILVCQKSFRRKPSKISDIKFTILSFSHQYTLAILSSWILWTLLLLINSSDVLQKWFILTQGKQNLEFVNLMCYLHTTHSSVLKHFVPNPNSTHILMYPKFALFQLRYTYLGWFM